MSFLDSKQKTLICSFFKILTLISKKVLKYSCVCFPHLYYFKNILLIIHLFYGIDKSSIKYLNTYLL